MKKIILSFIIIFVFITLAKAQLTATGNYKIYNTFQGIDYIIVFSDMDNTTEISYNGTGVNWYKLSDPNNSISNLSSFSPEDNTGYILKAEGVEKTFWVFNYQNYKPLSITLTPENAPEIQCKNLKINLVTDIPPMKYYTKENIAYTIDRNFILTYKTLEWADNSWKDKDISVSLVLKKNEIEVDEAPLRDTYFTLTGDQFATDLNISPAIFTSPDEYSAVAVACKITTDVTSREPKIGKSNEDSYPERNKLPISFSVPIDVQFLSNPTSKATYINWTIYKDDQLIINRTESDHRYIFTDYGTYKVKVVVSNSTCSYSDSIIINAYNAVIQVPNVFTPNGDDNNDEFRVAYKSLLGFECWVYNRWGRKVYYWNDPQKGWDGKINGKDAAAGPYFYIIKATGYGLDQIKHDPKVKSTIILKGDINLLRGLTD